MGVIFKLNIVGRTFLLLLFLTITMNIAPMARAGNSDCYDCHEDDSLTMDRNGREVSVYVDEAVFDNSVHGGLDCIDCHARTVTAHTASCRWTTGIPPWRR